MPPPRTIPTAVPTRALSLDGESTAPPILPVYIAHPFFDLRHNGVPATSTNGFAFSTAQAGLTSSHPAIDSDIDMLPDLPAWLLGFLVGCSVFISLVATALFLAQFRALSRWAVEIGKWMRWQGKGRRSGYLKINQEELELGGTGNSECNDHVHWETRGGLKKRTAKARHLSIDTAQQYSGLGIAVPGHRHDKGRSLLRRSWDGDSAHHRSNPPRVAYSTAPLRSAPHFTPSLSAFESSTTLEAGCSPSPPRMSASSLDMFAITTPVHENLQGLGRGVTARQAFLDRVNKRIEVVADTMARRFHDGIDPIAGPEAGLLLPVRDSERERRGTVSVFVG